ncbi:MAG: DUF6232 family protein [Rhodospirillaceae bacterium]
MPETIIYQDNHVTVTTREVAADGASCLISDIIDTMVAGGTGVEEKVFLSLIVIFGIGVALVGLLLNDNGELCLGLGLAVVTALVLCGKCQLRLATTNGRTTILVHRDIRYIRRVRDAIEEAMAASQSLSREGDALPQ